jgi:hypothetical protein
VRRTRLLGLSGQGGQGVEGAGELGPDGCDPARPGAKLVEDGGDDTGVLLEQDGEQVLGGHLGVGPLLGQLAGGCDGLLGLDGESISLHV